MIDIVCDNCEETFSVEEDQAGGKVPCPLCGDVNRVPERAAAERAAGPRKGLPPEEGPEQDILFVRPVMFRARPLVFAIIVAVAVAGIAVAVYGVTNDRRWLLYTGAGLALVGVLWWCCWYVVHLGQRLSISNKRTVYCVGLISRHTSEVLHSHIRNLQIRQNVWQRLTNVGDLVLDSSAGGGGADVGAEIRVHNIPGPRRIKDIIDEYRDL